MVLSHQCGHKNGLVLPSRDTLVQEYCSLGIASSTKKSYKSAYNQFSHFCSQFQINSPFPVSEAILRYFATFLAQRGLALACIKLHLASVCHMQVSMGYPEPRAASSLPQLRLVLNGISSARVTTDVRHGVSQLWGLSFTSGNGSSLTKRLLILKVRE